MLFFILSSQSLASDPTSFILKGKIVGKDTGYIYLYYRGINNFISDSFCLRHGEFMFRGNVQEPTAALFSTFNFTSNNRKLYDSKNIAEFYIEPGQMTLLAKKDSFKLIVLEGSGSDNDRVRVLRMKDTIELKIKPVMELYDVLAPLYNTEYRNDPKSDKFKLLKRRSDSIDAVLKPLYAEESQIDSAFIVNNPSSFVAADMLTRNVRGGSTDQFPDLKKLYDNFPPNIKESSYGQDIREIIESEKNIYIGAEAINFTSLTQQGDTISLNNFKNKKYVLLDFWGSWCGPCRHIAPVLREIHSKYKDKIELISIANHDKEADWLAAIKTDKMTWIQILDDRSKKIVDGAGNITDAYFVNGVPSLILIDKNLKIIRLFGNGGKNRLPILSMDAELKKILQ